MLKSPVTVTVTTPFSVAEAGATLVTVNVKA